MIVYRWSSSSSASFTPVTATVCASFQLPVVNVRDDGLTVASPASLPLTATVTVPDGAVPSFTVNESSFIAPPSRVCTTAFDSTRCGPSVSRVSATTNTSLMCSYRSVAAPPGFRCSS